MVPTVSLTDACSHIGAVPTFIKMDAEVAEVEILASSGDWLRRHPTQLMIDTSHIVRGVCTDLTVETQIGELVREKALQLTRDEVPHAISAEVEEMGDKFVRAVILVETDSQKQILVGKHGAMVKDIGVRARPEIEALLGHPIFLELFVKVRPRWRRDEATLERLGL